MWKRLHSNRNPQDTLWREIKREFGGHFAGIQGAIFTFVNQHPRACYAFMSGSLLVSLLLSFTLFQHPPDLHQKEFSAAFPLNKGINQVVTTAEKLKRTLLLKHLVDSLSSKKILCGADSLLLDSALTQLERIRYAP